MTSEVEADRLAREGAGRLCQFAARAGVRGRDSGAAPHEKAHGGQPGLAEPDDQRSFSFQIHRNFRVLSANSAQTKPTIQNRTITLDSGHPSCSK